MVEAEGSRKLSTIVAEEWIGGESNWDGDGVVMRGEGVGFA